MNTPFAGPAPPTFPPPGDRPLTNQEAKAIAENVCRELWLEFHPTATLKILTNLGRIFAREQKSVIVRRQTQAAEGTSNR
jgi:hypothetical protein